MFFHINDSLRSLQEQEEKTKTTINVLNCWVKFTCSIVLKLTFFGIVTHEIYSYLLGVEVNVQLLAASMTGLRVNTSTQLFQLFQKKINQSP